MTRNRRTFEHRGYQVEIAVGVDGIYQVNISGLENEPQLPDFANFPADVTNLRAAEENARLFIDATIELKKNAPAPALHHGDCTARYQKELATIRTTIKDLEKELATNARLQKKEPVNWGMVGDLDTVYRHLADAIGHLEACNRITREQHVVNQKRRTNATRRAQNSVLREACGTSARAAREDMGL